MGADEDLEQVVHKPTTDEQPAGKHARRPDDTREDLDALRGASESAGGDEPDTLKANLKAGTKSGTNIEAEKANLK